MPADLLSKSGTTARLRRANARRDSEDSDFDSSQAREIELKRSRGEISCAECRRLKIRCDKSIPCQSCQRRGCASLCPNGSLATGQGTRFVLAATEHLHQRIAKMGERIRQLEDALAILQARNFNNPHPLLINDQADLDADQDEMPALEREYISSPEPVDASGMLSISAHGSSTFFGPTGGTEFLLFTEGHATDVTHQVAEESVRFTRVSKTSAAEDIIRFSTAFPFTPVGPTNAVYELIFSHLPSYELARHLSESYLERAAWLFGGVSKQQLMEEMLPLFYPERGRDSGSPAGNIDYSESQSLGLLLFIFAIGALVEINQEPCNAEGERYYQLARAAMSLKPVFVMPSLVTIQALHLCSVYDAMTGNEARDESESMETSWGMFTLSAQLAQSIGLHRDGARWGLPQCVVERRRLLFWNLFVADSWQSLTTGRPPSFSRSYIDCKFPHHQISVGEMKEQNLDFESWSFRFFSECVAEVAAKTLTAEPPSYASIMALDRRVRDFPTPAGAIALQEDLELQTGNESSGCSASMQRFVLSHTREILLLYIHRSFFAQAIIDCPENPLRSAYAYSFLTAYRVSCTILKVINDRFATSPRLCARFWTVWTSAFSAAVVFGTVVTRGPRSSLAVPAMSQLDLAHRLFNKAAKYSRRAARALPIVAKLLQKAHSSLTAAKSGRSAGDIQDGAQWNIELEDMGDELEVFAGRGRPLSSKQLPRSPSSQPQAKPIFSMVMSSEQVPPVVISKARNSPRSTHPPGTSNNGSWTLDQTSFPTYWSPPTAQPWSQPDYSTQSRFSDGFTATQGFPSHTQEHNAGIAEALALSRPQLSSENISRYRNNSQYLDAIIPQAIQYAPYPPPAQLVHLGLTSRQSRLDERWTSFMHQSGFLDDINFRA
ncbi:hypothetical protein AcV7_003021 [Taiwanofungus camphoratus]|nr:hypothetical protein AcV7_003021 [Antrodia cinnamomea]